MDNNFRTEDLSIGIFKEENSGRDITRVTDKEFQTRNEARIPQKEKKTRTNKQQMKSKIKKLAVRYWDN